MRPRSCGLQVVLSCVVLGTLALGTIAATGCRSGDGHAATAEVLVGAAWPWQARASMLYGRGLDLAVDEVNATGGIGGRRLRILRVDDHESVTDGRLAAQQLAKQPGIVAVIGHLQSYVSVPAAAIYDLAGLVMIAPATTDPELTSHGYGRVFRTIFTDPQVGRRLADYAVRHGLRHAAIYYMRNAYGRNLANAFEEHLTELGASVIDRQSYDPTQSVTDLTTADIVHGWKARADIDVVLVAAEPEQGAVFLRQMHAAGLTATVLGGDALGTPELLEKAGPAAERLVVATPYHPDASTAAARAFRTAFEKRYGIAPDATAALGYDAVHVLASAMRDAGSTAPDRVAAALHAAHGWAGATGELAFDAKGNLATAPVMLAIVQSGRFAYLGDDAAAAPRVIATARQPAAP